MPDNQTQQEWLDLPSVANNADARGTGAYLDQKGIKGYELDVTYEHMIGIDQREKFRAFVWVPHVVASDQEVKQANCPGRCVKTCKKPGCLCDRSTGQCK